jgi:nicotinamidase-related amidase
MEQTSRLPLTRRTRVLKQDQDGRNYWKEMITEKIVTAGHCAIILCDMWDTHWSRGAAERLNALAMRVNRVVKVARSRGMHVIHAPSDVVQFYSKTPARKRTMNMPRTPPPELAQHPEAPLPTDDSDGGSDTSEPSRRQAWTRQHPVIEITDQDLISDDGDEIYSCMKHLGIRHVFIMGVHTNMCVLNNSFGIKRMVRLGVDVMLVRDLTDALYNPAKPPYVSHDEGTRLVVEYIEKFWCPTILSEDLVS